MLAGLVRESRGCDMTKSLVTSPTVALVEANKVPALLDTIRPQWQAKKLIERTRRLITVDPSSACQRIFNASIHDLREKIKIAGVDIAGEAAKQNRLPPIAREEDIETYSVARIIDLSYRMGLLSRAEWRRVTRCYEIRRDLEHEDDEYEAGPEDIVYVFKTCVEVVLSRDPIQLIRVSEFKDLIESTEASVPDETILEDFEMAPQPRQEEIARFLIASAMDRKNADLIQQNAFRALGLISDRIHPHVRTALGSYFQERVGRKLSDREARVAHACGIMPYVRQKARASLFDEIFAEMERVGTHWGGYNEHGELLRNFEECGGLSACPPEQRSKIVKWMVLTFIGTPGGLTQYGNIRKVFYSNSAAPIIRTIFEQEGSKLEPEMQVLKKDKSIKAALNNQDVARRFDSLIDLIEMT